MRGGEEATGTTWKIQRRQEKELEVTCGVGKVQGATAEVQVNLGQRCYSRHRVVLLLLPTTVLVSTHHDTRWGIASWKEPFVKHKYSYLHLMLLLSISIMLGKIS